jgi:inosine-uridine nucleoside N-ribohydrolase
MRLGTWAALLFAVLVSVQAQAGAGPGRKVIIDDDGFGLAQWLVVKAPDTDVLGLTVVSGDVWCKEGVAHALRGLELVGRSDIPVVPGATYPLLNSEQLTDRWEALYGKLVWKGAWMKQWVEPTAQKLPPYHRPEVVPDLPEGNPSTKPSAEIAANFLIRKVHEFPGQVTIIATGPFTNLALAQRLDPEFASLAKELVYMGGSLNPHQVRDGEAAAQFAREYVNSPRREFNFRFDPEAASIVLRAPWKKITMIPSDPSTATEFSQALVDRLSAVDSPVSRLIKQRGPTHFPLWDEIAATVWLDPSLIKQQDTLFVDVETQFGPSYGDTLSWLPGYQPGLGEQRETVVRTIDVGRTEKLMADLMARPQPQPAGVAVR